MTPIETPNAADPRPPGRRAFRRTASPALTPTAIRAMRAPQVRADGAVPPGAGRLKVRKRKTPRGTVVVEWLFIWLTHSEAGIDQASRKKLSTITLGKYSEQPRAGHLTIEEARRRAAELQQQVRAGVDPGMAREAKKHEDRRELASRVLRLREGQERTLGAMLEAYVTHLKERKKSSAYDVQNMFDNHVTAAFPDIAGTPAAEVTAEHVSQILTRLVRPKDGSAPKGRTALKLRSYMGASFKLALGASRDPMAPAAAADFGLTTNPAAAVPSESMARAFNRAGTRVLTTGELREYMLRLESIPSMVNRLALQLQLMTGGQRTQQLLRLTAQDIGESTFTLFDPKGRREQARPHVLPLVPEVGEVLAQLAMLSALGAGDPVGSLFRGRSGAVVNPETLSGEVTQISVEMVKANKAAQPFRLGDIRRTCETVMAETLGISKDTRAQLLSHGISGVQDVHYDKGEHIGAKAAALQAWISHLDGVRAGSAAPAQSNKVIPIRKKAA